MAGPGPLTSYPRAFRALAAKINELCTWFGGISAGPGIQVTKSKNRTIISLAGIKRSGSGSEGDAVSVVGSDSKLNTVQKHSTWTSPTSYPAFLRCGETGSFYTVIDAASGMTANDPASGDYLTAHIDGITLRIGSITTTCDGTTVKVDNGSTHAAIGAAGFEAVEPASGDEVTLDYLYGLRVYIGGVEVKANDSGIRVTAVSGDYTQISAAGVVTLMNITTTNRIMIDQASLANDITIDSNGIKVLAASSANYTKITNEGLIQVFNDTDTKLLTIDPALITETMSIREIDVCSGGVAMKMLVLASAPYTP